jgi:colanic acid biosynthesis glycosyl transferase WcaI
LARLLFTCVNYWPEPTGTPKYTTHLAEHFASVGHEVTVLAGMPHYPAWRLRPDYRTMRREEVVHGVRIVRRAHYVPAHQSAAGRAIYEGTFLVHALTACRLDRPDAIIGVIPSLNGGALARIEAARFRVPYGLIVQDLMGQAAGQSGISGGATVAALTRRLEGWCARGAAVVAAASTSFLPYLRGLGVDDERLFHLPNWATVPVPSADRSTIRHGLGWPPGSHVVLHAGNMGLKQGLEQVVEAARLAGGRSPHVRFVLLGDGSQRGSLQEQAAGLANVSFLGTQSDERYTEVLAAADVLLLSERTSVRDMSLPSKFTSYCAAGRPVVAAVRPDGATAAEVARSGAGLVTQAGDPGALLDALESLRSDPVHAARLGEAGRLYAAEVLSPARAFARADEFLARLLSATRRGS